MITRLRPHGRRVSLSLSEPVNLEVQADWRQTLTTLGGIVSVLLVAIGLFFTNAANRAETMASREQNAATRDELALARQQLITDRFSKAIEQLGSEKLDVRLGAIYALERIMRDSADDQPNIVEIISTHVRTHAGGEGGLPAPVGPPVGFDENVGTAVDVKAALTVLGRRQPGRDGHVRIDLRQVFLRGVSLQGSNFAGADFSGSNLLGINFGTAKLAGSNFGLTNLYGADLAGADLTEANLALANLGSANLSHARLTRANLTSAKLEHTDLRAADLTGAKHNFLQQTPCVTVDATTKLPPDLSVSDC
ncbi:pentapeptide repeat-containing protein [Micromonospora sp. HUAS LYJ1]|uniref:pentapeptide repeat-containing protein n=1 Tax=Micromonospora sp. HUAS LYJ1 TaxID=3061626 RepID=UPI002673CE1A|nr:pentapeptide repeat-containing protein [Micromonospora sp. HUAS LYJ1]WKU07262.1 pentapeptide repeat-containing protein [Micromonospora sp. HUAS LYJ1]